MKSSTLSDTQDHITEWAVKDASMTVYPQNSIAIVTRSGILKHTFPVAYIPFETTVNQDIKILSVAEDVHPRYAFHVIQGNGKDILVKTKKQGGTVDSLDFQKVLAYKVPVPPYEVQERLAKVLDNFDAICSDLNIGLPAEIEARKKQYEYYRDMLLTFAAADDIILTDRQTDRQSIIKLLQYVFGYVKLPLKDIATEIYRGAGITRDQVTESGIPCVRYGEIYTTYNVWFNECVSHTDESKILSKKYFEHGDVLFAITGEKVEDIAKSCVYMGNKQCLAGGDIVIMKHEQNPKYMGYVLSTTDAQEQKSKGRVKSKVVHSNVPAISEIIVPLPSLQKQAQIVEILDRFNEICNDLTTGLPAEIEARQKQYGYYRDKLLTFKELGA